MSQQSTLLKHPPPWHTHDELHCHIGSSHIGAGRHAALCCHVRTCLHGAVGVHGSQRCAWNDRASTSDVCLFTWANDQLRSSGGLGSCRGGRLGGVGASGTLVATRLGHAARLGLGFGVVVVGCRASARLDGPVGSHATMASSRWRTSSRPRKLARPTHSNT